MPGKKWSGPKVGFEPGVSDYTPGVCICICLCAVLWFGLVWIDFGEVFGGVVSGEGLKVGYVHHSPVVSPAWGGGEPTSASASAGSSEGEGGAEWLQHSEHSERYEA